MGNFYIQVDQKVTTWTRSTIKVEANSYEDAVKEVIEKCKGNQLSNDLEIFDSEVLYELETPLTVKENHGNPTMEIMNGDQVIWNNVDKFNP